MTLLGNLVVLAEPAAEVAVAEEYGAGPARAGNGRLFPKVKLGQGNLEPITCAADAKLRQTVNIAFEGTGATEHDTLYKKE
jgi:hypothetical protein